MKVLGIIGYRGSGKTTLIVRLIPELQRRGYTVSTIKHTHHNVAVDKAEDVSRALAEAGAVDVVIAAPERWAILHQHGDNTPEPGLESLLERMTSVDLLLVEGFKKHVHEKIEVHRTAAKNPLLHKEDGQIVAVATDGPLPGTRLPLLDLDDVPGIADFIVQRYGLRPE